MRGFRRGIVLVALTAGAALALAPAALATPATFTVNSNGDEQDATIDGVCATAGDVCTLRAAIQEANANANGPSDVDTIDFDPSVTGQITLGSELPPLTDYIDISGPGAGVLAVDGANSYRILENDFGIHTTISGLTLQHALAVVVGDGANGGAIQNNGALTLDHDVVAHNKSQVDAAADVLAGARSGGIESSGVLNLSYTTVSNNTASSTSSGATGEASAYGGGVGIDAGNLNVDHSTITGNTATAGGTPLYARPGGGGIYLANNSLAIISESTIDDNHALASGATNATLGSFATGAGIYVDNGGSVILNQSTLAKNEASATGTTAASSGSNLALAGSGTATTEDTIIAAPSGTPTAANCSGTVTSLGFDLEDADTCGFDQTTDITGQDPMLRALHDNGGPTRTMALRAGSPAIDKGDASGDLTDQRGSGFPRVSDSPTIANAAGGDGSDIGAFERDSVPPETTIDSIRANQRKNKATVTFSSSEAGSTFQCRLDKRRYHDCTSPQVYTDLADGRHTVRVVATDPSGNTDQSPAKQHFTV